MAETAAGESALVVVGLPESLGRRMRFGPFPSAREGLKFGVYAAIAGSIAVVLGVIWAVPLLGAGFLLSVVRTGGQGLDEQFGEFLAFCWRTRPSGARPTGGVGVPAVAGPYLTSVPGHLVAIVAAPGIPVAFLPPSDARTLFLAYREVLQSLERGAVLQMGVEPIIERPLLPARGSPSTGHPEESARDGYAEMVGLLCRRRYRRRVLIGLWEPAGIDAALRLERSAQRLSEGLGRMGVIGERLRDRPLRAAAAQMGWTPGSVG
ncbi:MAG: hypothetical protein L3K06_01535 [Thermoplasmata archaeon]|nr:hypothetical protein [Thermoplasmata archaeon]MCI4354031.1 hypothetical protein [Thermoplasmata archaeon]